MDPLSDLFPESPDPIGSPAPSLAMLRTVIDGLPALIQVADLATHQILYMNRPAQARFGAGVGHPRGEVLHDDLSGSCPDRVRQPLLDGAGRPTGIHVRDGEDPHGGAWLEYREQAIRWVDGRWARLCIAFDISTRKRLEEELRLAARACETGEGILITDTTGTIVKVNAAFTRITGYSEADALGTNPRILKSNRNDPALYEDLWGSLLSHGEWRGEIWNRRKDGEIYPQWLNITAVRDDAGGATHYVGHFQDISERKRFEARIAYQALYDALTDLPNRRLLLDRLEQRLRESRRHGTWGGLLFLDLDNFKELNDRLGHLAGDVILREAGQRISRSLRKEDTAARFGGDEFIVLLHRLGEESGMARTHLLQVADKVRQRLSRPLWVAGTQVEIATSIGATLFNALDGGVDPIIHRADRAMYRAKQAGKNRILFMAENDGPTAEVEPDPPRPVP